MILIKFGISIETIIFFVFLIFVKKISIYLIFITFTFVHEMGHMLVSICFRMKPKQITLMPFGFKMILGEYKKIEEWKKILIQISGPLVNYIIMFVAIALKLNSSIIYTNFILGTFNLIPIYPLDGGRIIKSILRIKLDIKRSYDITNLISNITIILITAISSIVILYIKNLAIFFVIIYLWYIVLIENKRYNNFKVAYEIIEKSRKENLLKNLAKIQKII